MKRRLNHILLCAMGILAAGLIASASMSTLSYANGKHTAGASSKIHASDIDTADSDNADSPEAQAAEDKAAVETTKAAVEGEKEAAGGSKEEENIGFPQLNPKSYASQVFWLLISFALLYTLMSKLALPRVASVIDTRHQTENANLSRAEQLNQEAAKIKEAYEASLAKAHDSAQEVMTAASEALNDNINAENSKFAEHARKRILSAEQNIQKAKEDAMASLADISAEIAAEMVNKIAGVQVAKADAKKVVTTVMAKERA